MACAVPALWVCPSVRMEVAKITLYYAADHVCLLACKHVQNLPEMWLKSYLFIEIKYLLFNHLKAILKHLTQLIRAPTAEAVNRISHCKCIKYIVIQHNPADPSCPVQYLLTEILKLVVHIFSAQKCVINTQDILLN